MEEVARQHVPRPRAARRPSPGRPTRAQALERDAELLDTALDMFLELGFERTSIEAVTAAVGMAKRTIYARYGDKAGLFRAALQRAIEDWRLPVERLAAVEGEDIEASLLAISQLLIANVLSPAGLRLLQITNAESRRLPGLGLYTNQLGTEATLAFLADLFARRIPGLGDAARADDARAAAVGFLHMIVGGPATMAAWGVPMDGAAIERQTRFNLAVFLRGLMPR